MINQSKTISGENFVDHQKVHGSVSSNAEKISKFFPSVTKSFVKGFSKLSTTFFVEKESTRN